jgi:hypothetical protein
MGKKKTKKTEKKVLSLQEFLGDSAPKSALVESLPTAPIALDGGREVDV